ncbi:MAG: hypothetical protein ACOCU8_01310 [Patescibacteria group bacterium]
MKIVEGDKFQKDFKRLLKKYKTLQEDFEVAKKAIQVEPTGDGSKHWNILREKDNKYILKMRMMCRTLRGSELRLIYFYDGDTVEVVFIEVYYKGNKERENKKRIQDICDIFMM